MQDVYKNIKEYNSDRKWKVFIVFVDMIADVISNRKLNQIIPELFIRGRKLKKTFAVFINTILFRRTINY